MMWNIFEFVFGHLDGLFCEVPAQVVCPFFSPTRSSVFILLFCRNAFSRSMICFRFVKLMTFYDPLSTTSESINEKSDFEKLNDIPKVTQLVSAALGLESKAAVLSRKVM